MARIKAGVDKREREPPWSEGEVSSAIVEDFPLAHAIGNTRNGGGGGGGRGGVELDIQRWNSI